MQTAFVSPTSLRLKAKADALLHSRLFGRAVAVVLQCYELVERTAFDGALKALVSTARDAIDEAFSDASDGEEYDRALGLARLHLKLLQGTHQPKISVLACLKELSRVAELSAEGFPAAIAYAERAKELRSMLATAPTADDREYIELCMATASLYERAGYLLKAAKEYEDVIDGGFGFLVEETQRDGFTRHSTVPLSPPHPQAFERKQVAKQKRTSSSAHTQHMGTFA